jgi:hypothetical protein|tara:strand:- start:877 stop:2004 length:1128 start_codon:yes stop_codon:yes gene_type:complete
MTTPTGAISFANLQSEFGGSNPISLSEYYSGGSLLGAPLNNVASSGAINMNSLRNVDKRSGSGNQVNVRSGLPNATSCIFITSDTCYSNDSGVAALTVPSGATGATTVVINHNIAGKGGSGGQGQGVTNDTSNHDCSPTGSAGNGAGGGPALSLSSPTFVDNNAAIRAGSGGGGGGSAFGGEHGFISNGITCTTINLKGIITNTNGNTAFLIGSGGGGGAGGNSNITNNADGAGNNAGGGGHATNFTDGNRNVYVTGTQCTANTSYHTGRRVRMVANSNSGSTGNSVGSSGISSACNGGSGGGDGNAGASTNASGNLSHPAISENGNSVSSTSATGSPDGGSGGGAGIALQGWNNRATSANGISSTQGTYTGGVS